MSGPGTIAIGYLSAPERTPIEVWMRWRHSIEHHAARRGMSLLRSITDDHTTNGAGLQKLVDTIRLGHVSVVVVPAYEHLSPLRDGTEDFLAQLLDIHFGARAEQAAAEINSGAEVSALLPASREQILRARHGFAACPPRAEQPVRRPYRLRVLRRERARTP